MENFLFRLSSLPLPPQGLELKGIHAARRQYGRSNSEINTWGDGSPGDVHISHGRSGDALILLGYIGQSSCLSPMVGDQQLVCDRLINVLEEKDPETFLPVLARSIHGSFTLLYIQPKEKVVYTITDRVNSRPIWYSEAGGEQVWISSSAIALARASGYKEYYPGGVAGYFLYGTAVEPCKSIFSHIRCQPEGSLLIHKPGHQPSEKKWYHFKHRPEYSTSSESWVTLAADCFVRAADRILRINPKPLLFLSGGVDSRLAAAALTAAGGKPLMCTLGDAVNIEVRIAKATARILNCNHVTILRDAEWYLRAMQDAVFSTNGTFSWAHSHFSQAYRELRGEYDIGAAILGDFCEAFSKLCCAVSSQRKNLWGEDEFLKKFDTLPLPLYRPLDREETLCLLKKSYRQEAEESIKKDIVERYRTVSQVSSDPLIVGDYFFRWQTTSCIATFQMFNDLRSAGPEQNLMFDKELHELLEIMPSSVRNGRQLGAKIIRRLNAGAAIVPNANSMLPLVSPVHLHSLAKLAKPMLGKIRRRFLSNTYKTTASWPHLPLLYAGHPAWKRYIEQALLSSSGLPIEIFDRSSVEKCWYEFCAGDLSRHADVERLIGFSVLNQLCN